ncbi:MAG: glycoside hydrolase family 57 protein [Candidatus Aenigmarchaeota archaeon]|nr:glycoside hydrolase family 57 protein [Candidatus Aenigmarchaeota archaeon]RLI97584.1 MAG: alpha-amylase [Candidatus Aenigmarchaeota archaeon]
MTKISLIFEVHQPLRLKKFGIDYYKNNFEERYFATEFNKFVFDRVASKCYWPATQMLLDLVWKLKDEGKPFKVAFSITGTWLEQAERYQPGLIDLFKQFPKGYVEFLAETYYHSLASLYEDGTEFKEQVQQQVAAIKSLFGQRPKVMTNTEMIYNNIIAKRAQDMGFDAVFTEGVPHILGWRSPHYVYKPPYYVADKIKVLLRSRQLTDDVGYRFSARWWDQWPLTAEKYSAWLSAAGGDCINLFMDYETIGEHQWEETGIFWFFKALPYQILKYDNLEFALPSEVAKLEPKGEFDVFELSTISWADLEMDVSAWLGNKMQQICFKELKEMEQDVKKTGDKEIIKTWRLLQTSDHLHNICTKWWGDGDVHQYFSYFDTPHQGFITLMEILHDFKTKVHQKLMEKK